MEAVVSPQDPAPGAPAPGYSMSPRRTWDPLPGGRGLPFPALATGEPRGDSPPERLPRWQEAVAGRLFRALAPRIRGRRPRTPRRLAPYSRYAIRRPEGGTLSATWFPAGGGGRPRGAVLLAPPWHEWGQSFLHYYGRLEALRAAGYHTLTFDPAGLGDSDPPSGLSDRDLETALHELRRRAPGLPLHFWGVSFGGYWAHPALCRTAGFRGAVFEDVAAHFIDWSRRMFPLGWPCYLFFQYALARAYRYLDLRRYAPHLQVAAAGYVGGDRDRGVPAADIRELARLAAGRSLVVPGADHLEAIRKSRDRVIAFALQTFEHAAAISGG
jgi:pimeloyl-ACP methyl ester carboxylesterase